MNVIILNYRYLTTGLVKFSTIYEYEKQIRLIKRHNTPVEIQNYKATTQTWHQRLAKELPLIHSRR